MPETTPFEPFELIPGQGDILLVCDHARNAVPPDIGDLGVPAADMARHIAYDIGARAVTLRLAAALGAPAVLSTFSRLVIDPNRGEFDPTLVMKIYDGSIIEGNRHVGPEERARRIAAYHRPYREALGRAIDARLAEGGQPVLVSIHSFTPQLRGHLPRPWHAGLLWAEDDRLFRPLMACLRRHADLVIGDNQPYSGSLPGDTMWTYGIARGLPHVLIEVRNDLIATEEGQAEWAELLAGAVADAVAAMKATGDAGPRPAQANDEGEPEMSEFDQQAAEAAAFRRLRAHLMERTDVQNIDMMNLAGFCRNCLSRWYQEAAAEQGVDMGKEEAREAFYGMPYDEWRAKYQTEATDAQKEAFKTSHPDHH